MKKLLGLMLAILLISIAILPQEALATIPADLIFSAEKNVSYSAVGDEITVPLKLSSLYRGGLLSLKTTVKYDASVLQYITTEAGPIVRNAPDYFKVTPEAGSIKLSFMDEELGPNAITNTGTFARLKFKVIKDIPTESIIGLTDFEANDMDMVSLNSPSAESGSVKKVKDSVIDTDLALTVDNSRIWSINCAGDRITIPVWLSGVPSSGLMSVEATLKYDSSYLQYIGSKAGLIVNNANQNFTVIADKDEIHLTFMDEDLGPNVITNNCIFANIEFKVLTYKLKSVSIKDLVAADGNIKEVNAKALTTDTYYPVESHQIVPSRVVFDINNPSDIVVTIQEGEKPAYIENDSKLLQKDVDYTVSGNTIIVKKSFCENISKKYPNSINQLKFTMTSGNTSILNFSATSYNTYITPYKAVFNMAAPEDVTVTISSLETLADIKAGPASLIKGVDYTVSGNTVKIAKSYYQYIFGKWPAVTNMLTFIMMSGNSQNLAATATGSQLVTPSKLVFDMINPSDISFTLASGETLADIKAGLTPLTKGVDYTISGSTVKISKSYYQYIFSKWPTATNVLTFNMTSGKSHNITATASGAPLTTPGKLVFDMSSPSDVTVTIANGETLADIKAGSASLTKGKDYTTSGNTVKISKSYYQYIFGKWPAVTNVLTFNMSSGKSAILIATAKNANKIIRD